MKTLKAEQSALHRWYDAGSPALGRCHDTLMVSVESALQRLMLALDPMRGAESNTGMC